jgi:hypothetical protein
MQNKSFDVIHKDKNGLNYICRPEKAKTQIMKWFCPRCNRYVLPDGRKHWTKFYE